ncbi:transglutaminase-like cysteine peptidase [Devosia sp.]|uniref:transglutaminase-like cysteine peptidase n=1 Tax=Devosia sp. TaxID=1871048 RepID=UPI003A909E1C
MSNAKTKIATAIFALLFGLGVIQTAAAGQVNFADPAFARTGNITSIPVGHSEFCKSHRSECGPNRDPVAAMVLTDQRWQELQQINSVINMAVIPVTDLDYYKVSEYWAYPQGYGDCEDFVLAKRQALIAAGWNPSTLLITVVRERNGNGHAVLMVRTDRGDLVLDNQDGRVLLWNQTPYEYLKRQSQASAGQWVDILADNQVYVAAAQ